MAAKMKKKANLKLKKNNLDDDNLGLDADHSSDPPSLMTRLDDDNDRISGNRDGENDAEENYSSVVYSPLDDK